MLKVLTLVGTRPELIKLSLVIQELDKSTKQVLVHTGQNFDFELNEIFFKDLGIRKPDHFLDCAGGTAAETIAHVIERVDKVIEKEKPDALLVYGDTNSCLGVISAKRRKVPIFHMEAGNRCFDMRVPEEINRKVVDHLSDVNMTLTEHARGYLIREGLPAETTFKIGSSMPEILQRFKSEIGKSTALQDQKLEPKKYFVVSAHREENLDDPKNFANLIETLKHISQSYKFPIIFSTHPRTRKKLEEQKTESISGVRFLKPLGFFDYVALQKAAFCVISDSGTITEESSILKFPAITIRNAHERPEGMDSGTLVMCGLKSDRVLDAIKTVTEQSKHGFESEHVKDYDSPNLSKKVARIILSYTDYVNRVVWSVH